MPINIEETFQRGGKELIDLLDYGVRSVQVDLVFAFAVHEYRVAPAAVRAVAIYDVFLAAGAPARIDAPDLLPPRELSVKNVVEKLRAQIAPKGLAATPRPFVPEVQATKYLFDTLAAHVWKNSLGAMASAAASYDPGLTPIQNLPGGKMSPGQRQFVEQVWQPWIRPTLVSAGFRRLANIA